MKQMIFVVFALFTMGASAQTKCVDLFSVSFDELVELDRQGELYVQKNEYDANTYELMLSTGNELTQATHDMRIRRLSFDYALRIKGDSYAALAIYRPVYERYKIALSELIKYHAASESVRDDVLRENAPYIMRALTTGKRFKDLAERVQEILKSDVLEASEILDIYDNIVARTVYEYRYAEYLMIDLATDPNITPDVKANVNYVRGNLTSDSFAERFPSLEVVTDSVIDKFASQVIKARAQIIVYWLKIVQQDQAAYRRKLQVHSLVQLKALQDLVYNWVPVQFRVPISQFIGMNYNVHMLDVHLESILRVVNAPTLDARIQALKEVAPQRKNMEQFLETFARLAPKMDVWIELKNHMGSKKEETTYKVFYEQMIAAEGKVKSLGYISMLSTPSAFDNYAGWVVPGIGAAATTAVLTQAQWWPWVEAIFKSFAP